MPNLSITKGKSRFVPFTVYGPRGPAATPPDIDVTSLATGIGLIGDVADGAVRLVPTEDGSPSRLLRVDAMPGASAGVGRFGVSVTARGRTASLFVDVAAAPNASSIAFDLDGASEEFDTPAE